MAKSRSVVMVGGPDAGKSNFLMRLWMALQSQGGCLVREGMPADSEYLNNGLQALQCGNFAPRTSREVHSRNVIPVRSTVPGRPFSGELVVPDCSGELWMQIHKNREWDDRWEAILPSLWGCLVFIRAGSSKNRPRLDWVGYADLYDSTPESGEAASVEMPTEVVLVDWLKCLRQALSERGQAGVRLRVGVVVTAWDRVPSDQQAAMPSEYIASNFPMFHHFAISNADRFAFEFFGASIAGDDFDSSPGFREKYLDAQPENCGYVLHTIGGGVSKSLDYSFPLAWAMGLEVPSAAGGTKRP